MERSGAAEIPAEALTTNEPGAKAGAGDLWQRRVRQAGPPLLVAIVGCAATFWFSGVLVRERRTVAAARASAMADTLQALLDHAVASRLLAFETLLELRARDGIGAERLAAIAAQRFGFDELAETSGPGLREAPLDARVELPFLEIVATLEGTTLRARSNVEQLIAYQLDRRAPDYAIRVHAGERPLYSRGEAAAGYAWWVQQRDVQLPRGIGEAWRLTLAPTPSLAALPLANLPAYFRTAGVVISVLLAALLYESGLTRKREAQLRRSHRALQSQVRDRERADAELRSLNLRLERHVAERTAELDAAVSDLEAFTYSVSHDLRSPLGAVVNFAGILKEDLGAKLDDEGREHLQRLTASALSALAMMDGLAALSKLGRARPRMERVDVAALAREVFDEAVVASARSGAELRLSELPIARADASMLRTVLTNLFTNALKFAAPGRPLEVEVGGRRAEGAEAVYWVRDNGVGFDPRFSERLFRVFERLHAEAGYSGTGIGLAVVARVVRFHGGRVWAEGEPDRGARFCFTLPAERE